MSLGDSDYVDKVQYHPVDHRKRASMAKAYDVATYLIQLANSEDEPDFLSHLRLQKLLYYTQGWSLALRGKPLFNERIEAWAHGPVLPDVFKEFADYRSQAIPPDSFPYRSGSLSEEERDHIESVWNAYKKYSALSLREMTHREPPWLEVRGGLEAGAKCSRPIKPASMKSYFLSCAK